MQITQTALLLAQLFNTVLDGADTLHRLVIAFQTAFGLKVDGVLGPVTARHIEAPRFCNNRERLNAGGVLCRFNGTEWNGEEFDGRRPLFLTVGVDDHPDNGTTEAYRDAFRVACETIEKHCAIDFGFLLTVQSGAANVNASWAKIDGPAGVLAESELSCGDHEQIKQRFDIDEPWQLYTHGGPTSGRVPLWLVALHEICHALGLPHGAYNGRGIMAPQLDASWTDLDPWTIEQLQLRYGPPVLRPGEAPERVQRVAIDASIKIDGEWEKFSGELNRDDG